MIEFPVVVCSSFDQIYAVDFYAPSQPESIKENFQLEVRYAYIDRRNKQRDDYFLLDFVEFSQLEKFAEAIDEDAKVAALFALTGKIIWNTRSWETREWMCLESALVAWDSETQ